MFVPKDQRGGGEGGGGIGIIVIEIPKIQEVKFGGQGKHKVLLVQKLRSESSISHLKNVPLIDAANVIADLSFTSLEKVEAALLKSLNEKARTFIRDGEGRYIDKLRDQLSILFFKGDIEFSSEFI